MLALAAILGVTAACPDYAVIAQPERAEIAAVREGNLLWLKQSLYVGQFYDDDRFRLVYPRRFEELTYLRTVEGDIITPPPADGIIPAGTRVRIERVDWPTGDAVFRRPLYTPRYATWVILRVAQDRGDTLLERDQKHILLLPGGIPDKRTFDAWLDAYLGVDDPNPWIRNLAPKVRTGVLKKTPVVGMDYEALNAAMGYPDRITRDRDPQNPGATLEVAIFGATSVVLRDGKVVRVSDPHHVENGLAQPAHEAGGPAEAPSTSDPAPADDPAAPTGGTDEPAPTEPAPVDEAAPTEPSNVPPTGGTEAPSEG